MPTEISNEYKYFGHTIDDYRERALNLAVNNFVHEFVDSESFKTADNKKNAEKFVKRYVKKFISNCGSDLLPYEMISFNESKILNDFYDGLCHAYGEAIAKNLEVKVKDDGDVKFCLAAYKADKTQESLYLDIENGFESLVAEAFSLENPGVQILIPTAIVFDSDQHDRGGASAFL